MNGNATNTERKGKKMDLPNDVDPIELLKEITEFISKEPNYPNLVRLFKHQIGKMKK